MEFRGKNKFKTFARINRYESATKILVRSKSHLILDDTCTVGTPCSPPFISLGQGARTDSKIDC